MARPDRDASSVRAEIREWLAASWDPDLPLVEWRTRLADSGWACPSWPVEWFGQGLPVWSESIVHDEIADAGAVGPPVGGGMGLAAPTILAHGPDSLRRKLLHPILTGEHMWCQLFSEPGNGSDLAGLTTRAERDGDEWVINGQKVWNTCAHHAEFGMLLARTDWDVPKHKGISYFALADAPTRRRGASAATDEPSRIVQRGVPHRCACPGDMMVGEPGEGWRAALTTLAHERRFAGRSDHGCRGCDRRAVRRGASRGRRALRDLLVVPAARGMSPTSSSHAARDRDPRRSARAPGDRGRDLPRAGEPVDRPACSSSTCPRTSPRRRRLPRQARGSDVARAPVPCAIGGAVGDARLRGRRDGRRRRRGARVGAWASIAGGTDQIQRNIIGEQVLGLPREPSVDRDMPFREVPRNTGR